MSIKYREIFAKRDFNDSIGDKYLDATKFYYTLYNNVPVETWYWQLDAEKFMGHVVKQYDGEIDKIYSDKYFDHDLKRYTLGYAVILMANERMLKFHNNGCGVLTQDGDTEFITEMMALMPKFKQKAKNKKREINLIVRDGNGLSLTELEIKGTKLDLTLNYEDDFAEVDATIRKRLNTSKDKGIVLLHGTPGTGKTTYLRYLITKLKKRVLFVPNNVAVNLTDPDFINLLIENPNSVLIIEDAEQVLQDRREAGNSAVSNLLNISDGLLADCLNIQIICSFNTELSNIDSALMRKGRLIARYEFGRLSVTKAQRLSDSLGFNTTIMQSMTVSEVYNQNELTFEKPKSKIGFSLVA